MQRYFVFSMTIVIKMFIIKLFLFYSCVVSILTYLYRHTLCDPTLPGMAQVSPNMAQVSPLFGRVRSGEDLFLIAFFPYAT